MNIIFLDDTVLMGTPTVRVRLDRAASRIQIRSCRGGTPWTTNAEMRLVLEKPINEELNDEALTQSVLPSCEHVTDTEFYANTGNDYRGEFRMNEAWRTDTCNWARVEYERREGRQYKHLRTCAWLDAGVHAPVWWSDHRSRAYYAAAVGQYHVRKVSTDENRKLWVKSTCPNDVTIKYAPECFDIPHPEPHLPCLLMLVTSRGHSPPTDTRSSSLTRQRSA